MDFVKGLAIILVVFGHCLQYGSGASFLEAHAFFTDIIFKSIYSFHMPLFALISGYLFSYSFSRRTAKEILKNQISGLCVPIVCWTVTVAVGEKVFQYVVNKQAFSISWIISLGKGCLMNFWFLWGIFWCSMAVIMVRKLLGDRLIAYLFLLFILMILPDKIINSHYIFLYPYFVTGYMWSKRNSSDLTKLISKNSVWYLLVLLLCIWLVMLQYFDLDMYIYVSGISLVGKNMVRQFGIDLFRWIIGFVGSAFVLLVTRLMWAYRIDGKDKNVWRMIADIVVILGRSTLGLYIISSYMNIWVLMRLTKGLELNYFLTAIESICILSVAYVILRGITRIKLIKKWYLGGR